MKRALLFVMCTGILISGCAAKKPAIAKVVRRVDARPGNVVQFVGVKDGHCVIAYIRLDSKAGYTIVCK